MNNLTIHVANSLFESNKDDLLIREYGYEVFDLIPREKFGPLGRVNVTFEECIFLYNYGGIFISITHRINIVINNKK